VGGPKRPTAAEVWISTRSTKAARNANRESDSQEAGLPRVNTSRLYWDAQRALRGERSSSPLPSPHATVPGGGAGREHLDPLGRLEGLGGALFHRPGRLARLLAGLTQLRSPTLAHTLHRKPLSTSPESMGQVGCQEPLYAGAETLWTLIQLYVGSGSRFCGATVRNPPPGA
jgi:hypothetical protein